MKLCIDVVGIKKPAIERASSLIDVVSVERHTILITSYTSDPTPLTLR